MNSVNMVMVVNMIRVQGGDIRGWRLGGGATGCGGCCTG